jgi:hypothetical protein
MSGVRDLKSFSRAAYFSGFNSPLRKTTGEDYCRISNGFCAAKGRGPVSPRNQVLLLQIKMPLTTS